MDFKGLELVANGTVPYGFGVMCNAQGQFLAMMDLTKEAQGSPIWQDLCKKVYISPRLYAQLKKVNTHG